MSGMMDGAMSPLMAGGGLVLLLLVAVLVLSIVDLVKYIRAPR